jgi:hypothetical protein
VRAKELPLYHPFLDDAQITHSFEVSPLARIQTHQSSAANAMYVVLRIATSVAYCNGG